MQFACFKLVDGRSFIVAVDRIVCCVEDTVNVDGAMLDVVLLDYRDCDGLAATVKVLETISVVFGRLLEE